MAKRLTQRQQTVIETIRAWIRERGYPPTIRELGDKLGIKSLRGVTTHLDAIAKKGFLKREPRARSIRLLDIMEPFDQAVRIPVLGRIRAGEPLLAQEQVEGHVVVDERWLSSGSAGNSVSHFALKVQGDSMMGSGILDGDYVIVRQQQTAINGDVVVALIGEEATVKRFFKEGDHIRLQPEHPAMEPLIIDKQQSLSILGKVVAVFRMIS